MRTSIFELIDKLLDLARLDNVSVEKVTGIQLIESYEQYQFFILYHGSSGGDSSELDEVELRYPKAKSQMKDGLLILTLHPDSELTIDAVRARFGQKVNFHPRNPEAPRSEPNYIRYALKRTRLSFGFLEPSPDSSIEWPGMLVSIVIDRTGC